MATSPNQWVHEQTFGRSADFWWRVDDGTLRVLRVPALDAGRKQQVVMAFPADELEQLLAFMDDGEWHTTSAFAPKLEDAPPTAGLAPFVRHVLGHSTAESRLVPHVAVVLTQAGLWEWNGRATRMRFRQTARDLNLLTAHFAARQGEPGPRPPTTREAPHRHARGAPRPPAFDLAAAFRGRNAELRGRLESVDGGRHPQEKGQRREAVLRDFLRQHLPARFGVGHGEVVTAWGETSGQMDILVFDALNESPFLDAGGALIVPVECLYAVIEVKPMLTAQLFRQALDTVRSVKALWPRDTPGAPPFGGVLASHVPSAHHAARWLRAHNLKHPPHVWVDAICVLDRMVIHRGGPVPGPGGAPVERDDALAPFVCAETGEDSLLYFHLLLRRALDARRLTPPDLMQYATGLRYPDPKPL